MALLLGSQNAVVVVGIARAGSSVVLVGECTSSVVVIVHHDIIVGELV